DPAGHRARAARAQGRPHPGRDLSRRSLRARLRRPLPAARRHGPQRPDHRSARQRRPADALHRLSRPDRDGGRTARAPRADPGAARVLPGQDRVAAQAQPGPRRALRRTGAGSTGRPGHPAGRGSQDRQRRARQRLRRTGHHRRHPLRPARGPARLDDRDRPGQGRARRRCTLREARLDDAVAPPDLARAAALPRQEAGVRCLPGREAVPLLRDRSDGSDRGGEAGQDAGSGV
ncbi:MAG: Endonuclease III, partial [uncultured Nocardioides sp.]